MISLSTGALKCDLGNGYYTMHYYFISVIIYRLYANKIIYSDHFFSLSVKLSILFIVFIYIGIWISKMRIYFNNHKIDMLWLDIFLRNLIECSTLMPLVNKSNFITWKWFYCSSFRTCYKTRKLLVIKSYYFMPWLLTGRPFEYLSYKTCCHTSTIMSKCNSEILLLVINKNKRCH